MFFTNLEGDILIEAKNKIEALQKITNYIYFDSNKPYGLTHCQSNEKIFLYRANVHKGKKCYTLFKGVVNKLTNDEEIVKFDLNFNYIKTFRF